MEWINESRESGEKETPSEKAKKWQKSDGYCANDDYKDVILEGDKKDIYFVKLEPSGSGYFVPYQAYEALREKDGMVSARKLSEGLQIGPWFDKNNGIYTYRSYVSVYKLEKGLEVAYGEQTIANKEYGDGGFPQINVTDFNMKDMEHNKALGLIKIREEKLKDYVISKEQYNIILEKIDII